MTTLVWFRQDLRIADNPALAAALGAGSPVIPVYLLSPDEEGSWPPGSASRWWLHHSLAALAAALEGCGSRLCLRASEDALASLVSLAAECGATRIVWNRRYEPASIARDQALKTALRARGVETDSYNSALLYEPWTVKTKSGGPFQVFTPFWRHCLSRPAPPAPLPAPTALPAPPRWPGSATLDELRLLPTIDWAAGMREAWTPGSRGAHARLDDFLQRSFRGYREQRDLPAVDGTSRLSPHLHFGEIGPRQIWHAAAEYATAEAPPFAWRESTFLAEIGWREFAHHLLYHYPQTPERPLRANYARFPWTSNVAALDAWKRGATGYPIVDAGMRQLWHTGWMHNRVRMIVASFLIKDLLINWTEGERWFWDTLVDADLASNTLGWQWVAGCGADAAPFFRIFNPTSQGTKFDPTGAYVRRWVPELARLPDEWLHEPWNAPAAVLHSAAVALGNSYPVRLVEHEAARRQALAALSTVKKST